MPSIYNSTRSSVDGQIYLRVGLLESDLSLTVEMNLFLTVVLFVSV